MQTRRREIRAEWNLKGAPLELNEDLADAAWRKRLGRHCAASGDRCGPVL